MPTDRHPIKARHPATIFIFVVGIRNMIDMLAIVAMAAMAEIFVFIGTPLPDSYSLIYFPRKELCSLACKRSELL